MSNPSALEGRSGTCIGAIKEDGIKYLMERVISERKKTTFQVKSHRIEEQNEATK